MDTKELRELMEVLNEGKDELDKEDIKELDEMNKMLDSIDGLTKEMENELGEFEIGNLFDEEKIYLYRLKQMRKSLIDSDDNKEKLDEVNYLISQFTEIYSLNLLFDKDLINDVREKLNNKGMKSMTDKVIKRLGSSMYKFHNPKFIFAKLNKELPEGYHKEKRLFIYPFFKFISTCELSKNSVFISKLLSRLTDIETDIQLQKKLIEYIDFVKDNTREE